MNNNMDYNLEFSRIVREIEKVADSRPKTQDPRPVKVCLQFPDGLKANATDAVKELDRKLKTQNPQLQTQFFIWSGSNFGGCDYPWYLKELGFDLLANFGHAVFKKW